MPSQLHGHYWLRHSRLLLMLILLIGMFGLSTSPISFAGDDLAEAKVFAVVWANPSVKVMRGDVLTYTIRVRNVGSASASFVRVTLSYDPLHLTLEGSEFESNKDWVSDTSSKDMFRSQVTVTFGDLGKGTGRAARLHMRVRDNLADNTIIQTWGKFNWIDDAAGERSDRATNAIPVLVAPNNEHTDMAWLTVSPVSAPANIVKRFYSDRFLPDEEIIFWINRPDGSQAGVIPRAKVDPNGRFELFLRDTSLYPGVYQMVATGMNSELVGTAMFTVE